MGKTLMMVGIAGASYVLSLALSFVLLIIDIGASERWGAEKAVMAFDAVVCLVFLLSAVVVAIGAWRALSTTLARIALTVGYIALAVPTVLLIAFLSLVVFNR